MRLKTSSTQVNDGAPRQTAELSLLKVSDSYAATLSHCTLRMPGSYN